MHAGFWCRNLKEIDDFEDLDVYGWITLKWILKDRMRKNEPH